MTPEAELAKKRVMERWPDCYAAYLGGAGWIIRQGGKFNWLPLTSERRAEESEAWINAAARLDEESKG